MAQPPAPQPSPTRALVSSSSVEGPVQIITVAADGVSFELHENRLNFVLKQVPAGMKVSIVSVVGAFRTGKSFILDVFLRYLRWTEEHPSEHGSASLDGSWLYGSAEDEPLEGNVFSDAPDYSSVPRPSDASSASLGSDGNSSSAPSSAATGSAGSQRKSGFKWRGGHERMTTGIWLWSRPFIRKLPGSDEEVAVFLMDTQGLFDSETGQMLTTSIFGLSTLISSYQVYNVSRQIQEDTLQHLALFTEYGRRVLEQQQSLAAKEQASSSSSSGSNRNVSAAAVGSGSIDDESNDADGGHGDEMDYDGGIGETDAVTALRKLRADSSSASAAANGAGAGSSASRPRSPLPPFQRLEFLIRDAIIRTKNLDDAAAVEKEMADHLASVLSKTHNKDLKTVRDHIKACFEDVSAFALPHPGYAVAENDQYGGTISEIRDVFRKLVVYYVHRVFDRQLAAKKVTGRCVGAPELQRYIVAYARLFQERSGFPEAKMLLEATAEANNRNAYDTAYRAYCSAMDSFFSSGYCTDAALLARHGQAEAATLALFDELANFGSESAIADVRSELVAQIAQRRADFVTRNSERDPMKVVGPVLVASGVAFAAWLIKQLIDLTCAPWLDVCRRGSQMFAFIYSAILIVLFGLGYYHRAALSRYTSFLAPIGKQLAAVASASLHSALEAGTGASGRDDATSNSLRTASAPARMGRAAEAAAAVSAARGGGDDIDSDGDGDVAPEVRPLQPEPSGGLASSAGVRRRAHRRD